MKTAREWLLFVTVAAVVYLGLCTYCEGALEDAIASTCRVRAGSSVGTGFCIANQGEVWVMTNAHVVRDGGSLSAEFYWEANKSTRIPMTLVWKKDTSTIDVALLKTSRAYFAGRVPPAVTFGPKGYVAPKGTMLWTVGCPGGAAPTALRSTVVGYETRRAGIKLIPKVEMGRSGSGVFDETGTYLLGIVDTCDPGTGGVGYALYLNQLRALLTPMARQETKLFGPGGLCQGGFCQKHGGQQQQAPPGTGQAYPQLPPLKGIDDPPPLPAKESQLLKDLDFQINDILLDLIANEDALNALQTDLADKEQRLKVLFGEDYALLKEMAADARAAKAAAEAAKATAEDASEAVEDATADLKEKAGLIDRLKTRLDNSDLKTAAAAKKVLDVAGTVKTLGGKLTPWSLATRFGWMPVGLGIGLLVLLGRVEYNRRKGKPQKTKLGDVLAKGTGAVAGVREDVQEWLQGAGGRVVAKLFGAIKQKKEEDEDAEILSGLGEALKGGLAK